MGQGLRLALQYFLGHLRDGLILLHALLLPEGTGPLRDCSHCPISVASDLSAFGDLLQLVVPKELRAPVLQNHVEGQVLGVAPPSADRARKPSPLAAKPGLLAHPHPRADHRFFGPHKEPSPSAILFLRYPAGRRLGCPMPKRCPAKTVACSLYATTMPALRR